MNQKFEDEELWDLDFTIADFILPRLIRFKELNNSEGVEEVLDKMILAFELIVNDDIKDENEKIIDEGLKLFSKNFRKLWL
jgi:hypothetical protein